MFNPWGLVFIVLGIAFVFVGYKGTQDSVFAFLTGHAPGTAVMGKTAESGSTAVMGKTAESGSAATNKEKVRASGSKTAEAGAGVGGGMVLDAML